MVEDELEIGGKRSPKRESRAARRKEKAERIIKDKFHDEVKPPVQAKTAVQKEFLRALKEYDVIVFSAPAGVGKTYLTMSEVSDWLKKGDIDKLVLSRPAVPMGRTIGLVPGDLRVKYELFLQPLLQVLWKRYGKSFYETGLSNGTIELLPGEYCRGRSIDGCFVLDEAQSFTPDEIYTMLTRVEEGGKLIMIGDPNQNDLRGQNGIDWIESFVKRNPELTKHIKIIKATSEDIVRGGLCKAMVMAKEKEAA